MSSSNPSALLIDEQALREVPARTTAAWKVGDATSFAAAFSTDSQVVIAGRYLRNRDEITSYIEAAFSGWFKGTQVVSDPVDVRYLGPDTALVMTEGGVLAPGETVVSPKRALRGTWILVKENDEWVIGAYHSSPIPES